MKAKLEPQAADTATAHKIAAIFYSMIKHQTQYDETIWEQCDAQRRHRHTASLKRQAARLGYQLILFRRSPKIKTTFLKRS
jgi:hypothetical protein